MTNNALAPVSLGRCQSFPTNESREIDVHRNLLGICALGVLVAGCATPPKLISSNENLLRVGEKPVGYPRTFMLKEGATCVQVTEDWRSRGNDIWVKDSKEVTVSCSGISVTADSSLR